MSARRNLLLSVGILGGMVIFAVALVRLRPEPPRTPPPSRIPEVQTAAVRTVTGPLTVEGSGTVRARAEVALAPQVGGRVAWQSASLIRGGRVSAGELLLRIEAADYENAVRQAEAQVAEARVGLLQAEEEARIALEEYRQFAARSGVSVESASPLTLREPQLESARAALARAEAQLADAQLSLDRTELTSPFDGVVVSESVDVGNLAQPGIAIATLFAADPVEVIVPVSDLSAGLLPGLWQLRAGDGDRTLGARVRASYGGRSWEWEGFVDRAQAALDEQTRTVDVILRVPNPFTAARPVDGGDATDAPPLLVGEFVDVAIDGTVGEWSVVPRTALQTGNEVWLVENERVRIVPVRVLQRVEERVYVDGDIPPGSRVVVAGITLATNGMEVTPVGEDAGPPPMPMETASADEANASGGDR